MKLYQEQELYIYNSLSKQKERFDPIYEGAVGMYVCGPTVYSNVHMGNCRTFLSFDLVFRYLKHLGFKVRYVRNITDAGHLENDGESGDDPILKKARIEQLEPMEVVQKYSVDFHNVMDKFNALPPSIEPTATGHIIEQIKFVQDILFRKRLKELQRSRPLKKTALTMDPELAERLSAGEPALPPIPEYVQALPQMQMAQPVAPEPSVTPAKVKQVGGKLMGMAGQYLQGSQQPRVYESYNPPHITSGFRY